MSQAMSAKPRYDRAIEDVGNIVELGHVNIRVPDQVIATRFYITALGLTRDPFLNTGIENMWANVGRSQFHLPTGQPQRVGGIVGLVIPGREALLHRLHQARGPLAGTQFEFRERDGHVDVICPWGNHLRVHEPAAQFGQVMLGLPYVALRVAGGAATPIAAFYREMFGATAEVVEDHAGASARVSVGIDQHLLFREEEGDAPAFEGAHVQISLADFSGPHRRMLERGLVTEESDQHQWRFHDIVDPSSGTPLLRFEHEVRSMRHPMFGRALVNRNPASTPARFVPGYEAAAWMLPPAS
jgi:hypothetical protein